MMKAILRNRAGMTLIEMLLAIAISSIIGIAIMKIFQSNSQLFSGEKKVTSMVTTGRNAIGGLSRLIRQAGYNPTEESSGLFGLRDSTGNFTTNAMTDAKSIYFTMDDNEDGSLAKNSREKVALRFTGADCDPSPGVSSGCIEMAAIDSTTGAITGWTSFIPDIQDLVFIYHYRTGTIGAYTFTDSMCGASGGITAEAASNATSITLKCGGVTGNPAAALPDDSISGQKYSDVAEVTIYVLAKTRTVHDLTKQNEVLLYTSSVLLRSK